MPHTCCGQNAIAQPREALTSKLACYKMGRLVLGARGPVLQQLCIAHLQQLQGMPQDLCRGPPVPQRQLQPQGRPGGAVYAAQAAAAAAAVPAAIFTAADAS